MFKRIFLSLVLLIYAPFVQAESDSVGVLFDTEVLDTVNKIIAPICKAAKVKPTNIYILTDNEVNAFVTQGNELFINTGLISEFNDPDVLKGVVAHELAHLASGHPIVRQKKVEELMNNSILTSLLGISAMLTGNPDLGLALIAGGTHATQRMYLKYSREQETVADRLAVQYLHASGSSVEGFAKLTERFAKQELYFGRDITPYMLTHPLSKERLQTIRMYLLQEKNNQNIRATSKSDKDAYARIVAKIRAFLATKQYQNNSKDLTEFAKQYGDAIYYYKNSEFGKSFEIMNNLIKQNPTDGYLHELNGQFLFETGKLSPAIEEYKKAVTYLGERSTVSTDYALMLIDASDLSKGRDSARASINEALAILNKSSMFTQQKNPYIFRKLAVAYGKLELLGYSNLMLAEEALLLHRKDEAKRFLKIAQHYAKGDMKLKLQIDDLNYTLNGVD